MRGRSRFALVSNEGNGERRATEAVDQAGKTANGRLGYGVTPLFSPDRQALNDMLKRHRVWVHSGHGHHTNGITVIKKVESDYRAVTFKASDITDNDLDYDLVFMNTCESTDTKYYPLPPIKPESVGGWDGPHAYTDGTALLDIGQKLNAKNYIGWDCEVMRQLSVSIPKMLMQELDSTGTRPEDKRTVADAVQSVWDKLQDENPRRNYWYYGERLRLVEPADNSVILDLNRKPFYGECPMKSMTFVYCTALLFLCAGTFYAETEPQVPQDKKEHYESLVRKWVERLWVTNDCFVARNWSKGDKPAWTHHHGIWTNEFKRSLVSTSRKPTSESMPWSRIECRFSFDITNRTRKCYFVFLDDDSDTVLIVNNYVYHYPDVFYSVPDYKPIHTNEQQARQKAAEYAALFGVSNLWDKTKFECRSFGFFHGVWEFAFTPFVNGYPTLYPISINVADLPGYPLGRWLSCLYQIPTNLPTKVALTSEGGKEKGIEYLKKYFPLKDLVPKLAFHSNRLEYIHPDYNYIRPEDDSGFSDYKPKWDEVALVWANTFKKPEGEGFPWVTIYVDAGTGEMLGGSD